MIVPTFCRFCHNGCSILVEIDEGRPIRVTGDRASEVYRGYTCAKGRALAEHHNHPQRLLKSQKRVGDGEYKSISSELLMDEVAERIGLLVERYGPAALASYTGTGVVFNPLLVPGCQSFMNALGSPMCFTSETLDQAGKKPAQALHGSWLAPGQGFDRPDVGLIIGGNPLVSHVAGLPYGSPGVWLREWQSSGFRLIVIDPRQTETANRAHLHLQPRSGQDIAILAGLLRIILVEGLYDSEFVADNVAGVTALREAVESFTPERVASLADLPSEDIFAAARIFGQGRRGFAVAGTGPNMSGQGVLFEYLVLALNTICGRWLRQGERVRAGGAFLPEKIYKAQAKPPIPAYGLSKPLRATGLTASRAGLPTSALPDEILTPGPGSVRGLISCGGNPVAAWPDQLKTLEAVKSLDLLIQVDVRMSATAKLADYVVAPKMSLEVPAYTATQDILASYAVSYAGYADTWAQYTDSIVETPPGSDLLEEWEFFYGIAQRLGLQLELGIVGSRDAAIIDMERKPTTGDLLRLYVARSRVPLDEIKRHPHGAHHKSDMLVQPKDPGWTGRLDVGNTQMMSDLRAVAEAVVEDRLTGTSDVLFPYRLISHRTANVYNSTGQDLSGMKKRRYNPAFMNPLDLEVLGILPGDVIEIRSERASVMAIVETDGGLRQGLVALSHAFGDVPGSGLDISEVGTNVARLLTVDRDLQTYTGQPHMSNIPVSVHPFVPPYSEGDAAQSV